MSGLNTTQVGKDGPYYELTVIYAPDDAANLADAVDATVKNAVKTGFEVCSMDIEGKKVLAYPVTDKEGKEHSKGVYAFFILRGYGHAYALEDAFREDHRVLRYLLVKQLIRKLKEYK